MFALPVLICGALAIIAASINGRNLQTVSLNYIFKPRLVIAFALLCLLSVLSQNPASAENAEDAKLEIQKVMEAYTRDWNAHNISAVMSYYADDYVNSDGYDKKAIEQLTKDLWQLYPDIKSSSSIKQVRVEGSYATVISSDEASGNTADEMAGLGTKGELRSQVEGHVFLKHLGVKWRIIGDRTDYEKIRVAYGLAKQLEPNFSAPEQVRAGKQFSAKLEVELPTGLAASGSINQSTIDYPLARKAPDKFKQIGDPITEHPQLERVMTANSKNRNEVLMASIALTNASGNSIMGYIMVSRRLNVVPPMDEDAKSKIEASAKETKVDNSAEQRQNPDNVK